MDETERKTGAQHHQYLGNFKHHWIPYTCTEMAALWKKNNIMAGKNAEQLELSQGENEK